MGFHQLTISDTISPEMAGLNGLVDVIYTQLAATNTYFSRHIAKSVFSYYCCVYAYARLLRLAQLNGLTLTHDEVEFVHFIEGSSCVIPEPLSLYLAAFGKIQLASGTVLRFRIAPRAYTPANGIVGFFDVTDQTHFLYGAYPCLAVCTARNLADTAHRAGVDHYWQLPDSITHHSSGQRTANKTNH